MKTKTSLAILLFLCVLAGINISAASHKLGDTIILQEHLGRTWSHELIHYDYTFAPGECASTEMLVRDGLGKKLPAQLSAITKHADGSIRDAQVWFLVSLQPNETRQFTLQKGKADTTELKTTRDGSNLEVQDGLLGARFHIGTKQFEKPISANEVPCFLKAIRLRGGGWTGRGWLETPKKCRNYKVELAEFGPVFARMVSNITSMVIMGKAQISIAAQHR